MRFQLENAFKQKKKKNLFLMKAKNLFFCLNSSDKNSVHGWKQYELDTST